MRIAGTNLSLNDTDGLAQVVYFQGCSKHCEGCHNPELQDKNGGFEVDPNKLRRILETRYSSWVDNIALQGGEPLEQPDLLVEIANWGRKKDKKIWLFTGIEFEEIDETTKNLVDVIKCGPYIKAQRDLKLVFMGSRNQRLFRRIHNAWEKWDLEEGK